MSNPNQPSVSSEPTEINSDELFTLVNRASAAELQKWHMEDFAEVAYPDLSTMAYAGRVSLGTEVTPAAYRRPTV